MHGLIPEGGDTIQLLLINPGGSPSKTKTRHLNAIFQSISESLQQNLFGSPQIETPQDGEGMVKKMSVIE